MSPDKRHTMQEMWQREVWLDKCARDRRRDQQDEVDCESRAEEVCCAVATGKGDARSQETHTIHARPAMMTAGTEDHKSLQHQAQPEEAQPDNLLY